MWRRQVISAVNWVRPQRFTVEMNLVGVLKADKSLKLSLDHFDLLIRSSKLGFQCGHMSETLWCGASNDDIFIITCQGTFIQRHFSFSWMLSN